MSEQSRAKTIQRIDRGLRSTSLRGVRFAAAHQLRAGHGAGADDGKRSGQDRNMGFGRRAYRRRWRPGCAWRHKRAPIRRPSRGALSSSGPLLHRGRIEHAQHARRSQRSLDRKILPRTARPRQRATRSVDARAAQVTSCAGSYDDRTARNHRAVGGLSLAVAPVRTRRGEGRFPARY